MPRLLDLLQRIARGGPGTQRETPASGSFFERGQVVTVHEDGRLSVSLIGQTVDARPTTDEVFRVGDLVWLSRAGTDWIVHGGVR